MKKLLIAILFPFALQAQDTTKAIVDSSKGYPYPNAYIVINSINIRPPALRRSPIGGQADSTSWITDISISAYTSKADYRAGKGELFTKSAQTLYTANYPTRLELLARFKQTIQ